MLILMRSKNWFISQFSTGYTTYYTFQLGSEVTKKPAEEVTVEVEVSKEQSKKVTKKTFYGSHNVSIVRVSQYHFHFIFHFPLFFFGHIMISIESLFVTFCNCKHNVRLITINLR
jgi:hypothetical protein